jgi:C-terminal processing protease CtpA/Prc
MKNIRRLFLIISLFTLMIHGTAGHAWAQDIYVPLVLGGTTGDDEEPTPEPQPEPVRITGSFTYDNISLGNIATEHAVLLADTASNLSGIFLPLESQVIGLADVDEQQQQGSYLLNLPAEPSGTFTDLDNNAQQDTGVQVFSIEHFFNVRGGPFAGEYDHRTGFSGISSLIFDDGGFITGGMALIWAPDDQQQFPTEFGADGIIGTEDDPVAPIPPGYSVINLNTQPFTIIRQREPEVPLHEPEAFGLKDYSQLSYTDAFQALVDNLRTSYAFNGIPGKEPDWDSLSDTLMPRIMAAQQQRDTTAFCTALMDFVAAFEDGHVGVDCGLAQDDVLFSQAGDGYGLVVRELDDGRVLVTDVLPATPAEHAGIQPGDDIVTINGQPVDEVIAEIQPPLGSSFSTSHNRRYQQVRFLMRSPPETTVQVGLSNPVTPTMTVTMTSIPEMESLYQSSLWWRVDPMLPVEFHIISPDFSPVGYITVNDNLDDLNLTLRLFERALQTFEARGVQHIIVDMRYNSGGRLLGLAGFLTENELLFGNAEAYNDVTESFEFAGLLGVSPIQPTYHFDTIILLVGMACASACEYEAASFSTIPGTTVIGDAPTAGMFGGISGLVQLPDGITFAAPDTRVMTLNGELFIEGTGVIPDVTVPVNEQNVLSSRDIVFWTAVEMLVGSDVPISVQQANEPREERLRFLFDIFPPVQRFPLP